MTDALDRAVLDWESKLILQLGRLAGVQAKLMKQLVHGRIPSEVAGAAMDLHNIANHVERVAKECPQ